MALQLRKYIKKVTFAKFPYQYQYSHIFKDINQTKFHTLLNVSTCV